MLLQVRLGLLLIVLLAITSANAVSQISQERFGKNRLQFEKKKWHYIKTNYFDIYFTDSLDRMAEFTAIHAEKFLPAVENEIGYVLPSRLEIILYSNFNDYLASNLGKGFMWQRSDDLPPTVNAKLVLYYSGYQKDLSTQIRQGLINFLYQYYVAGSLSGDVDEANSNQRLPLWITKGYIAYKAESWNTQLDDELRNLILNASYTSFEQFYAFHPLLAGHAFWYYIELLKGKEGTSSLSSLLNNTQSVRQSLDVLLSKKEKEVKSDFMEYMEELYSTEGDDRDNVPDGDELLYELEDVQTKYYNFVVHPDEDNTSYAYVKYDKGLTKVIFVDDESDEIEVLRLGYRFNKGLSFRDLPFLTWNNQGDQLAIAYPDEQKIKVLLYNTEKQYRGRRFVLKKVEWVQSMKYDFKDERLLISALKNGQSDIFVYRLDRNQMYQITNDPYDDLDPSPLLFSNKTSIIYSSNRPLAGTTAESHLKQFTPSKYYNIFTVDDWLKGGFRTINKLTTFEDADATAPAQYSSNYFSFLSDKNGIRNRYLGRVISTNQKTKKLTVIAGKKFVDLPTNEIENLLIKYNKQSPDTTYSIGYTKDFATVFPITNLTNNLYESKTSGKGGKITQVYYDGDFKTAYATIPEDGISSLDLGVLPLSKFKIQQLGMSLSPISFPTVYDYEVDTNQQLADAYFLVPTFDVASTKFSTSKKMKPVKLKENLYSYEDELGSTPIFKYKLRRFHISNATGFQTGLFTERLQAYSGGVGPIFPNSGASLNLTNVTTVTDVAEDYELYFGINLGLNQIDLNDLLGNSEISVGFNNYRRRLDWGISYRLTQNRTFDKFSNFARANLESNIPLKQLTHFVDLKLEYPIDALRSIRLKAQIRNEQYIYLSNTIVQSFASEYPREQVSRTSLINRLEWVYDNTYARAQNIPDGLKYKIYLDWIVPVQDGTDFAPAGNIDPNIINIGTDIRYYYPVYKDLILAGRLGLDMSFGDKRILYYLGGSDSWYFPLFNNLLPPDASFSYAYQALAVNLRGFKQNAMNGSSNMVLNLEARVPSSTFTNRHIKSLFLRSLQLVVFTDLGTAWNDFSNISRPTYRFTESNNPVIISKTIKGLGPFIGGFGAGLRLRALGQYLKFDLAWNYDGFFQNQPIFYFAFGFDF